MHTHMILQLANREGRDTEGGVWDKCLSHYSFSCVHNGGKRAALCCQTILAPGDGEQSFDDIL